jgi:hypothetical protein
LSRCHSPTVALHDKPFGKYPIEQRDGEIEHLRAQANAMAFDAGVMLNRIGDISGWRCLDLACGVDGITD